MGSNDQTTHIKVGDVLNNAYEIKRLIARGGMGEVFEAVTGFSNTDRVAIKVMLPAVANNPHIRELFFREAQTLTELQSEYIVSYRASHTDHATGLPYIVTSYIDGPSIKDMLPQLRPDPHELSQLMLKLVRGLEAAHAKGIYHRDISPDNILLEGFERAVNPLGRPRIIDFGIARVDNDAQQTIIGGTFAGKLNYVAPEQLGMFNSKIGPWTDEYSLALVILAIARGAPVNMGDSLADAVEKRKLPIDVSAAPEQLQPLLSAMLVADPSYRLGSMSRIAQELDPIDNKLTMIHLTMIGQPLPPQAPSLPRPAAPAAPGAAAPKGKSLLKSPLVLAGGGIVLAGLAAAGLYFGLQSKAPLDLFDATNKVVAARSCAWLKTRQAGSDQVILNGAAKDANEIKTAILDLAGGDSSKLSVDLTGVAPLTEGACAIVDSMRPVQSTAPVLTADQYSFEMKMNGSPRKPDALAAVPTVKIQPKAHYAVYLLDTNGLVLSPPIDEVLMKDLIQRGVAETGADNSVILHIDTDVPGWAGVLVLTGDQAINLPQPTVLAQADQDFVSQLAKKAKEAGWTSDFIWLQAVNKEPG